MRRIMQALLLGTLVASALAEGVADGRRLISLNCYDMTPETNVVLDTFGNEIARDTFSTDLDKDDPANDTKYHVVVRGTHRDYLLRVEANDIFVDGVSTGIDLPDDTWDEVRVGVAGESLCIQIYPSGELFKRTDITFYSLRDQAVTSTLRSHRLLQPGTIPHAWFPEYHELGPYAIVRIGSQSGLYDPGSNSFVLPVTYSFIGRYGDGRYVVGTEPGWYRYFDIRTQAFSDTRYRNAFCFSEGHAIVEHARSLPADPSHVVIDRGYKVVAPVETQLSLSEQHGVFRDGLAVAISTENRYGFIDTEGHAAIPFIFDHARNFSGGVAFANLPGTAMAEQYEAARDFVDPHRRFRRDIFVRKVMIARSGRVFDQLMSERWFIGESPYHNCVMARRTREEGGWLLLDLDGNILWEEQVKPKTPDFERTAPESS